MAFDAKPSSWISSWAENGTTVSFDLADLTQGLTAAEADASAGDWRACLFSILDHSSDYYRDLATENKPAKFTITKSGTLQKDGSMRYTYSIVAIAEIISEELPAESLVG